jgi:hypothetical protein
VEVRIGDIDGMVEITWKAWDYIKRVENVMASD